MNAKEFSGRATFNGWIALVKYPFRTEVAATSITSDAKVIFFVRNRTHIIDKGRFT
jgi:hypothetical protein